MEALVITGYALYAVAVGLTGSMYMVSITEVMAGAQVQTSYGMASSSYLWIWCRDGSRVW